MPPKSPGDYAKVQFRAAALGPALAARAEEPGVSISNIAARDLARYYDLIALALASVDLSAGEASLLVDALNGTIIDLQAAQLFAYEVQDSLADGLAEKWGVDGPALVKKIQGWNTAQRLAVCDAVERFWRGGYRVETISDRLALVGLIRRA